MSVEEVEAAETWPGCGVGVALGRTSGIVALDWDYDGGVKEVLEAITPGSLVKKVGSKGYTAFYKYSGEVTKRWNVGGERVLELLSDGTQTVLPPSIHPDTGKPYYWSTNHDLTSIDWDDLAPLPADFAAQIERALAPYTATGSSGGSGNMGAETEAFDLPQDQIDEICAALAFIPADDRDVWVDVGMSLKSVGEKGFFIWDNWSKRSEKYDSKAAASMRSRWNGFTFTEAGKSYKSIFRLAIERGFKSSSVVSPGVVGNMAKAAQDFIERNNPAKSTPGGIEDKPEREVKTGLVLLHGSEIGDITPPDWLVKGIQVCDSLAMTYGPAGGGKTFNTLDKALHVAAGKDYHGRPVKQGAVVYVAGEGRVGIAKRARAWCKHHGVSLDDIPFFVTSRSVAFLDSIATRELSEVIHNMPDENPVYIIIDTLARNYGDGDENSTKDMSRFVDALDVLRVNTGACVEVVHHTGKGEAQTARGNSALRAALDTEIAIKPVDGGLRVTCTKQKDAEQFEPLEFKFETIKLGKCPDGDDIESLVCVRNVEKEREAASLAAMLENGGKKNLPISEQTTKNTLESLYRKIKHNRPEFPVVQIEKAALASDLIAAGVKKSSAYKARDKAVEYGWIKELPGGVFYEILIGGVEE
jgi:hypothetical protein